MVGHLLLALYHIEKIINDKKSFSNGDVIVQQCPTEALFSGASLDTAVVFREDKKL